MPESDVREPDVREPDVRELPARGPDAPGPDIPESPKADADLRAASTLRRTHLPAPPTSNNPVNSTP
ncbi:hypothetical protein ACKI1I_35175 [Streptomyces turgidiscabies]|uniref:Uncharacterized protein n=1 Tax=Streptomyces turgidiscabies (strain Car8) TaxID=698760 RepID=L7EZC7_STRT8|nr:MULTISPECIES: hypothetical protein [Streptomyces]ELP64239.1 hypothetical protein STRTUCAR8_04603 [Streptomyces turgidiscabies Car8]MDX3495721.1 hypothetical protein [Streptomyces turgidiscabies]